MKNAPPPSNSIDLPMMPADGATAVALDRSSRGRGLHGIFLIESGDRQWVIKSYGRSRGPLHTAFSRMAAYLTGRSAGDPQSRFLTEKKALDIWRQNGFEVFQQPGQPPPVGIDLPHLVLEYVSGPTLKKYFADPGIVKSDKLSLFRRFILEWGRRHYLAKALGNRYLIQKHATFQHVLVSSDGRLIFYDFETVYTRPYSLPAIIAREICGYMRSLFGVVAGEDFNDFLEVLIAEYPHPEFLTYPYHYFFCHPNKFVRIVHLFDRQLHRNRRPKSKYNVALRIQEFIQVKKARGE